jgi:tRNA A37 methylthiotransferase MiaB
MKVAIIPPPLFSTEPHERASVRVHPPLGTLCLATVTNENGHEANICDLNVARRRRILPARSRWYEAAADYILSFEPELVGFGTLCNSFPTSVLICQALKSRMPSLTTVFGGPHASLVYRDLLREVPEVDFVLTGEADFTFTDLLGRLETCPGIQVQGLAERRRADIVHQPYRDLVDPDKLPIPHYGLWPFEEAIERRWCEPHVPIDAGRGCPYTCTFCATSRFFGQRFRMKSPARIVREMKRLYDDYGFTSFGLASDTFTVNRQVVNEVCHAIANSGIPAVRWRCSARLDTVDRGLLETMRNSGCIGIVVGAETGTPRMQRIIRKNLDLRKVGPLVEDCLALELDLDISTIVGFPEENWHDVGATVDVVLRLGGIEKVYPQVYILSPQPGTPITEEHGGQLRFDGYYLDWCNSNRWLPRKEQRFVKEHPELCPEFYFIPNERVSRRELKQVTEYASLLLNTIPGLTAFLRRVCDSPLTVLRRWSAAAAQEGLAIPNGSRFFHMKTSRERCRYLEVLLDLLASDYCSADREVAFLTYFRCILDSITEGGAGHVRRRHRFQKLTISSRSSVPMDVRPVLARACAVANMRYDVLETITRWRKRGQWRWPRETDVSFLFAERRASVSVARVARATNIVARRCDGRHSIRDLVAIVDCLEDPETSGLRASLGTRQLTALILACLCRSAGLRTA